MTHPTGELIEVAKSALRSMQRRYPNYISTGRIKRHEAERRMAVMGEIIDVLREIQKSEGLPIFDRLPGR